MIISRVDITNYKQYGGSHSIEVPESATIGVIGANGMGKTTLFEAIEWALYNPSAIKSGDVRPRTFTGFTKVAVVLQNPANGKQYLVERELKKSSSTTASVYSIEPDGSETILVQGPKQVTDYVTTRLIGLEHKAFVATFFTRQKELGFFGGSPTDRRREVGKLLGLETVQRAQAIIAEERKSAAADARIYAEQYAAQSAGRDFDAESATLEDGIRLLQTGTSAAAAAQATAAEHSAAAEASLAAVESLREKFAAASEAILRQERARDIADQQRTGAQSDLDRIAEQTRRKETLAPIAAQSAALRDQDTAWNLTREQAVRKREATQHIAAIHQRRADVTESVRTRVLNAPIPGANAWSWQDDESTDTAIPRLTSFLQDVGIEDRTRRVDRLALAQDLNARLVTASSELDRYLKAQADIVTAIERIESDVKPEATLKELDDRIQALNGSNASLDDNMKRLLGDIKRSEGIRSNLQNRHEGEICPYCQRPFVDSENDHVIAVLTSDIETKQRERDESRKLRAKNDEELRTLVVRRQEVAAAATDLTKQRERLALSRDVISSKENDVATMQTSRDDAMADLALSQPPTVEDVATAREDLARWQRAVELGPVLQKLSQDLRRLSDEETPVRQTLSDLGDVSYDQAAHQQVIRQLHDADEAITSIRLIDEQSARIPELEARREASTTAIQDAKDALATLTADRAALGFEQSALIAAQEAVRGARSAEREATERRHQAEQRLRDALNQREHLARERDRIAALARTADERRKSHDDLDAMYKGFTEFEQYAAGTYLPLLSDITSDLVNQVTDGKYDRVEFDSNFSIEVFDGDDEKFPYESFSGGERDAIALCARLALSRVIGGASANPPGFLVLDEVFGSLDLDRRRRLLDMLGQITGSGENFRQVFIISHVDDVRTSPVVDELWQVSENESGTSEIAVLPPGTDIGEL